MYKLLVTGVLALALTACVPTRVVAVKTNPGFSLKDLRNQSVAFWPIPTARIDPTMMKVITKEYGSDSQFLDSLGEMFSARLAEESQAHVIGSRELVAALGRTEATRLLLDANRLLGPDSDNRFASTTQTELAPLGAVPELSTVRYLVVPRDGEVAIIVNRGTMPSYAPGAHGGTGAWVGGSGSSANMHVKLRLVVMDWSNRSIVWDGWVNCEEIMFFWDTKSGALHKAEAALIQKFIEATGVHALAKGKQ